MSETQKEKAAAMHEATDIGTLIERVEAATGPDRDLDLALVERFGTRHPNGVYSCAGSIGIAQLTGSIDAAVSLVEKVRPGARWGRCIETGDMLLYTGRQNCFGTDIWKEGKGATPALSLISALLRSLQSEEPSNG